jgi:putative transposase
MDVTVYRTLDNIKSYIYILIDNFSRFIFGYRVSLSLSGKTCLEMLRNVYDTYLSGIPNNSEPLILITDGGPENKNDDVAGFINQPAIPLKHLIAQKDIHFSNSMVEAFNKTLKYRHLFPYDIRDHEALVRYLEKCIPEYNNVRPHCAHKYRTPSQVYFGQTVDMEELRKRLTEANKKRILENRIASCPVCIS